MKKRVCIDCEKEISFYATRCSSCAKKGNTHGFQKGIHPPDEWKKGNKPWNTGKKWSKENVEKITAPQRGKHYSPDTEFKKGQTPANKGVFGRKNPQYKGGHKLSMQKVKARRRGYGFIELNTETEGDVAHHITDEYVVFIPEKTHKEHSGYKKEEHRKRVWKSLEKELPGLVETVKMFLGEDFSNFVIANLQK